MKVAVAGFGIEGKSSLDYFSAAGHEVVVVDQNPDLDLPEEIHSILGDTAFEGLGSFDQIIRSSGINPAKLLEHNPGIEDRITTQLNEFLKVCPSKNIIGVTGTKGKGTTSTLIAKMIEASGKPVTLGGNIGVPMLSLLDSISVDTFVVLELSSFQLSDLKSPSPHIALCLMVDPEHLDWHGDLSSYIEAKSKLFLSQTENDIAIFYSGNELSERIAGSSPGQKIPYFKSPGAFVREGRVVIDDQVICSVSELKLLGEHNWQNVCAAVTATWQVIKSPEAIASVLTSFSGLEHRLEFTREVDNVRYINDSFASQLKATEAALKAIPGPKVLIVGGYDRMLDLKNFSGFIKDNEDELRSLVIIGSSGKRLSKSLVAAGFNNFVLCDELKTMEEIVTKAKQLASPGDTVVLSPGFASFDMFKDFSDRGQQFKEVVKSL